MGSLLRKTGGLSIMSDTFTSSIFKQSFQRLFLKSADGSLAMGFNATLEVQTSRELKVCGMIGLCASLQKKAAVVSETEIGVGGTNAWKLCSLTPTTTTSLYFEVVQQPNQAAQQGGRGVIQFVTHYQHASGQYRLRVTTAARKYELHLKITFY